MMKKGLIGIFVLMIMALQGFCCLPINTMINSTSNNSDEGKSSVLLSGKISHDKYESKAKASCEFTKIPRTYEEFVDMYKQAAVEPQGAAAMFILALDLYRTNVGVGKRCMNYCIYQSNTTFSTKSIPSYQMRVIKDKLRGKDSYAQPYISKAFYEGATPTNKYTPEKYKINFYVKPHDNYEPLSSAQAYVIPLKVRAYGVDWNNNKNRDHNIEVIRPAGEKYYLVYGFMDLFNGVLVPNR